MSSRFKQAEEALRKRIEFELVGAVLAAVTAKFPNRQVNTVEGKNEIAETVDAELGTDLFFASNLSRVSVKPQFSLILQHGLPAISGHAEFRWFDRYDWDREKFQAFTALIKQILPKSAITYQDLDDLQACNRAKVFDVEAKWKARVQPKQGPKDLIAWLEKQPQSRYAAEARTRTAIMLRSLFFWFDM